MTQFDFVKTGKRLAAATLCAAALFATALPAAPETQAATITVQGNTTGVGNCIPFGCPGSYAPTMGFVYKNIPSFTLDIGDVIAFDTGGINDTVLSFDIHIGATATNGGTIVGASGMTQIVANGTPSNPLGNGVVGDFDLAYTVTNAFTFLGGGLVIAFQPTGALASDTTNVQNLVHSHASDSSSLFVSRFFGNAAVPVAGEDVYEADNYIGHFQLITSETVAEPAALALLGLGLVGIGVVTRRRG